MGEQIGYQSGIAAAMNALRKAFPQNKAAWDKLERTLKILADDHDAALGDPPPPGGGGNGGGEDPPPPQVAPRTYNKVSSADARFCVAGLPKNTRGLYYDAFSSYDENGLDVDGGRTGDKQVAGLKPANEMDDRGACDPYGSFPPWPAASYEV